MPGSDLRLQKSRSKQCPRLACVVALTLYASQVLAQSVPSTDLFFVDGNRIHEWCQSAPVMAQLYAQGVIDGQNFMASVTKASPAFCLPPEVVISQVGDMVCREVSERPEIRHFYGALFVQAPLSRAWPCP